MRRIWTVARGVIQANLTPEHREDEQPGRGSDAKVACAAVVIGFVAAAMALLLLGLGHR